MIDEILNSECKVCGSMIWKHKFGGRWYSDKDLKHVHFICRSSVTTEALRDINDKLESLIDIVIDVRNKVDLNG